MRQRSTARIAASIAVAALLGVLAWAPRRAVPLVGAATINSSDARAANFAAVESRAMQLTPDATVTITGDGLDSATLQLLAGRELDWTPPTTPLGLAALTWPKRAVVGERIIIRGRLDVRDSTWVALTHPDGHRDSVRTDSTFTFVTTPKVSGQWLWTLSAGSTQQLGVDVRDAPTPGFVFVEGRPGREAAAVARLVVAQGGWMLQRTRLTAQDERITTWGTVDPSRRFSDTLLARADVVVFGPGGYATLGRTDRDAVERQVARGLGAVFLVDSALTHSTIFPFAVTASRRDEARARVVIDSFTMARLAIPIAPVTVAGGEPLMRTTEGTPVAWRAVVGAGAVVASRVVTPSRWGLAGDDTVEAAWWAALLGAAMRPPQAEWRVDDRAIARVDHPLSISRVGPPADSGAVAEASATSELALRATADTLIRRATLWPRDTGWMRISEGNDTTHVYVSDRDALVSIDRADRRRATGNAMAGQAGATGIPPGVRGTEAMPLWWVWALIVATLSVVWRRASA